MTSMNGRRGSRADELLADWDGVVGRARRPAEAPTGPAVSGLGALARFAAPAVFAGMVVLAVGVTLVGVAGLVAVVRVGCLGHPLGPGGVMHRSPSVTPE